MVTQQQTLSEFLTPCYAGRVATLMQSSGPMWMTTTLNRAHLGKDEMATRPEK